MNARTPIVVAPVENARPVSVRGSWDAVFLPPARVALEHALAEHIASRRWYRSKTRTIRTARIVSAPRLPLAVARARIVVVEVELDDGTRDHYVVPLAFELGEPSARAAVLRLDVHGARPGEIRRGVLVDALGCKGFRDELLATFREGACVRDGNAELRFHNVRALPPCEVEAHLNEKEQTNSTIFYGDRFVAKLVRKLDPGESPDVELGRVLTEIGFAHTPALHGFISLAIGDHPPATVGLLHERVKNQGDAWDHVMGELDHFLGDPSDRETPLMGVRVEDLAAITPVSRAEAAAALIADAAALRESTAFSELAARELGSPAPVTDVAAPEVPSVPRPADAIRAPSARSIGTPAADLLDLADGAIAIGSIREVGPYAELARLLGQRIGEMHVALASAHRAAFTPDLLDTAARVTLARSLTAEFEHVLDLVAERDVLLDARARRDARRLFAAANAIKTQIGRITSLDDPGCVIRVHGDLHLGQVLFTGDDFAFIDFEGEPARRLEERRAKRSPIVDIAGMLRSFHYAAASALRARPDDERDALRARAHLFRDVASAMLLRGWLSAVEGAGIVPEDRGALRTLLGFFLLEKCIYEIRYELDNRPRWVDIPLEGLVGLVREASIERRRPQRSPRRGHVDRDPRPAPSAARAASAEEKRHG